MVDVFSPAETTVYLTIIEYNKLLAEYRDMLLKINNDEEIPEPNIQYQNHDAYKNLNIKDIVSKLDGNLGTEALIKAQEKAKEKILEKEKEMERIKEENKNSSEKNKEGQNEEKEGEKKTAPRKKVSRRQSVINLKMYKIHYLKKVARLAEGASFGELALLTTKPRSSTIKAVTKVDMAILNKDQFKSIFAEVDKKILKHTIEHTLSKQQVLYKEGNPLNYVYLITYGEFEVSKRVNLDSTSDSIVAIKETKGSKKSHIGIFISLILIVLIILLEKPLKYLLLKINYKCYKNQFLSFLYHN